MKSSPFNKMIEQFKSLNLSYDEYKRMKEERYLKANEIRTSSMRSAMGMGSSLRMCEASLLVEEAKALEEVLKSLQNKEKSS